MNDSQRPRHVAGSVRHAEKRRTSTCQFADAIATVSVNAYRSCVSESFREHQKQTCMATIVAHFDSDGHLQVMAMGVGTKFLTERILREEERGGGGLLLEGANSDDEYAYGSRVRDCHAEVLARRAFQRQISLEMKLLQDGTDSTHRPVLCLDGDSSSFKLVDGVTLHFLQQFSTLWQCCLEKVCQDGKGNRS